MASRPLKLAATLGEKLQRGELGNRFRLADVYLHGWACLDTPERAWEAIRVLVDAGWARPSRAGVGRAGGRNEEYTVNPAISSDLASLNTATRQRLME